MRAASADWGDTAPEPVRRWPWRRSARTDEEGRLRLSGLPAGPYRVQVARGEVPLDAEPLAWAGHDLPETEVRAPSAAAPR